VASEFSSDDEGDARGGRRRRRKTTDLLGDAPLAPLSIDEAVEAVEASRDPKDARRRLWDKIKARAAALVGPRDAAAAPVVAAPSVRVPKEDAPPPAAPPPPVPARAAAVPAPAPAITPAPASPPPDEVADPRARLKARLAERAVRQPAAAPALPTIDVLQDSPYVEQRRAPVAPPPAVEERRAPSLPEARPVDDLAAAAEAWLAGRGGTAPLGVLAPALSGHPDVAALRAALLAENARRSAAGLRAPFVFRFDGHVGLTADALSPRDLELEARILTAVAEQREIVRRELLARVGSLGDVAFEQVVLDLLGRLGFGETRTVHRGRATLLVFGRHQALGGAATAMVVRRSASEIGAETLDALRGALDDLDATHGLILTAGTFSAVARSAAVATDAAPVTLIDGAGFARLLDEHGLGVVAHAPTLRYVDAAYFDSLD
jgi:restriction endonuclease Mrr